MIRKILFFLTIVFCSSIYSQELNRSELDSLFNLYVKIRNYNYQFTAQNPREDTSHIKCSFGIAAQIFTHFNEFSESQKSVLKLLISRPSSDTSIVSPSGFFRIHFNTSGFDVPQYNVNEFALALDSSYNFEVNYLGYPPPPSDTIGGISPALAGGDGKYDVYIVSMGSYGETDFETSIGSNRYTSFMQVHYSFGSGFYTHGIDAARVTAAHEFHHSIQVGNYILRDNDIFFYELTSTSMEEFVFNTVNDYYGYMTDYFLHTDRTFASNNGYNLAIWNIFLKDQFGFGIIKRQWELMRSERAIDAINSSLLEDSSSFGNELNKFGVWTYFTNYRSKPGEYFSEASNYPLVYSNPFEINNTINLPSVKPLSNNFLYTVVPASQDSLYTVLTNTDYSSGIDSLNRNYNASYSVYNYNIAGSTRLDTSYYELLNVNDKSFWLTSVVLNGILIKQDSTIYTPNTNTLNYAYPNPFRYDSYSANIIRIPVISPIYGNVDLYIYSPSMDLIFYKNLQAGFGKNSSPVVFWKLDEIGKKLPSGIYIYVTKSGTGKTTGKLVIFND
jgi:hypothetical protein